MKAKILIPFLFLLIMSTSCRSKSHLYVIETNLGDIKIKLYENTPLHKANFEKLVKEKTYDGVVFHRVIKDFMIQGGNITTKDSSYVEGDKIPAEFVTENIHKKGALAAARTGDFVNPEKASSPTQFYIVQGKALSEDELKNLENRGGKSWTPEQKEVYKAVGGTPFLDMEYTVFGEVVEGLETVDKIAEVPTKPGDRPVSDVRIIRIKKD